MTLSLTRARAEIIRHADLATSAWFDPASIAIAHWPNELYGELEKEVAENLHKVLVGQVFHHWQVVGWQNIDEAISDTDIDEVISDFLVNIEHCGIRLIGHRDVADYLAAHPGSERLVRQIWQALVARLPSAAEFALELYRDPEIDDKHLLLTVACADDWEDTIDTIEEVVGSLAKEYAACIGYIAVMPATD